MALRHTPFSLPVLWLVLLGCRPSDPPAIRVTIDGAHDNLHTATGRYEELAERLRGAGYRVRSHDTTDLPDSAVHIVAGVREPLSKDEVDAFQAWVADGNSLLIAADHPPFASPPADLAAAFGFEIHNLSVEDAEGESIFSLPIQAEHPLSRPDARIWIFTGTAVGFPEDALPLLSLDHTHSAIRRGHEVDLDLSTLSMAASAQHHQGRVVVVGESGMFACHTHDNGTPYGLCTADAQDNAELAMDVIRWLAFQIP